MNSLDTFTQDLNDALPDQTEMFNQADIQILLDQGVSKSAIRRLKARAQLYKCMTCPYHGIDERALRRHLRDEKDHLYGTERLTKDKNSFVKRLLSGTSGLTHNEINEFNHVHAHYKRLAAHEQSEYVELLYSITLQIRMKR